jgi:NitT/TauT family transport system permease protein
MTNNLSPRWHLPHLPHSLPHFGAASRRVRAVALLVALLTLVIVTTLLHTRFQRILPGLGLGISLPELLMYTGYTVARLAVAYVLSLVIALLAALLVTTSKWAETWLMPVFDILQSVPALAFFPVAVLAFAHLGFVEGSALFILLTGMVWSLLFNIVGAIRAIPRDVQDAARMFGARDLKYVRHVLLPAIFPALVTGSMLAVGAGWNIIIVAEYINFGAQPIVLPGLGSLLDRAASGPAHNTTLFVSALISLVLTIISFNRLVWHRLLVRAERYKFE